jgi:hypothetical protein
LKEDFKRKSYKFNLEAKLHEVQFFAATYICTVHQKMLMLVKLVMPLLRVGRNLLQELINVINAHCLAAVFSVLCISVQYEGITNPRMDTGISLTKNYEQSRSFKSLTTLSLVEHSFTYHLGTTPVEMTCLLCSLL